MNNHWEGETKRFRIMKMVFSSSKLTGKKEIEWYIDMCKFSGIWYFAYNQMKL